jgi:hypothetical protein
MRENDEDSDNLIPRDGFWQLKYKLRTIEEWRQDVNRDRKQMETRVRELEDWQLEHKTRLRDFIKWVSILTTCITTAIEIIFRLLFK